MGKKALTFKILPSNCGKSSTEVIGNLVQQTINKAVGNSQAFQYKRLSKNHHNVSGKKRLLTPLE